MKMLIVAPLVIILTLIAGTVSADDRHGWRGNGQGRHTFRNDGPDWRVSINFNRNDYRQRQFRRAWSMPARSFRAYNRGYRQGVNTGLTFGSLFTTGFIGNYSAIGHPGRNWRQSSVHSQAPVNRHHNDFARHGHDGGNIVRCYESGYDRNGREYRVELDPGQCR